MLINLEKLKEAAASQQRMESYPKLIYDPIRQDIRKYLEETAPDLAPSVGKIAVSRLQDGTGYGGLFSVGTDQFWFVMTGRGFKFKKAEDPTIAQTRQQSLLDREQRRSVLVRRHESAQDMSQLVFDLSQHDVLIPISKAERARPYGHVAYTRKLKDGRVVYIGQKGAPKQRPETSESLAPRALVWTGTMKDKKWVTILTKSGATKANSRAEFEKRMLEGIRKYTDTDTSKITQADVSETVDGFIAQGDIHFGNVEYEPSALIAAHLEITEEDWKAADKQWVAIKSKAEKAKKQYFERMKLEETELLSDLADHYNKIKDTAPSETKDPYSGVIRKHKVLDKLKALMVKAKKLPSDPKARKSFYTHLTWVLDDAHRLLNNGKWASKDKPFLLPVRCKRVERFYREQSGQGDHDDDAKGDTPTIAHSMSTFFENMGFEIGELHKAITDDWKRSSASKGAMKLHALFSDMGVAGSYTGKEDYLHNEDKVKQDPDLRRYAKWMYLLSQASLKQDKVKSITLYRGVFGQGGSEEGGMYFLKSRPLSSWTDKTKVAENFMNSAMGAGSDIGVYKAEVPATHVYANFRLFGNFSDENEYVVLGTSNRVVEKVRSKKPKKKPKFGSQGPKFNSSKDSEDSEAT